MLMNTRVCSLLAVCILLAAGASGVVVGQNTSGGVYAILVNSPQQIIKGLGVELQCDSIGSGNNGLPIEVVAVPHDLIPSEQMRFYTEMLTGFRYLRLAMGLFLRGNDSSQQQRYPGQMEGLYNATFYSGIEGLDVEYWSPAPYWKSTGNLINGTLKSFNETFISEFAEALIQDIEYLNANNLKVVMWGLQNEPAVGPLGCTYSCCGYTSMQYYQAFKVIGPKIKEVYPDIYIHVDSWGGQSREIQIQNDTSLLPYYDAWTWHIIGVDSNEPITKASWFNANTNGKAVFTNEFEYLYSNASDANCLNTAQTIMNWFTFENSPAWFWLHALKPTYNSEASGYSLGFWRPWDDNNTSPNHFPDLPKGHWQFNNQNWFSVAGFLKYMGWDAQRYTVKEDVVRFDQRILAFSTSTNKMTFVLTNRASSAFTFNMNIDQLAGQNVFDGHLYTPSQGDVSLGSITLDPNTPASIAVNPLCIHFWVQR